MLRLVKRGSSPYWYIRGSISGQRYEESTGTTEKAVAQKLRARREWEITESRLFGKRGHATFARAVDGYLEHDRDQRFVDKLLHYFGTAPLSTIDQAAADKAARDLYPEAAPATLARQLYGPLIAILRHASKRKLCDIPQIERPELPADEIRWLTSDEAEKLIAACDGRRKHLRPLVVFFLYTGARAGEALSLEWRDVDLMRAQVIFPRTTAPSTGHCRAFGPETPRRQSIPQSHRTAVQRG